MKKETMKRIVAMAALVALIPVSGWAQAEQREGKRWGPSPQALQACADRSVGDAVELTTRNGELRQGICREIRGELVAIPEGRWMGGDRAHHLERIARALDLTAQQREQIGQIRSEQRSELAPLREQMKQNRAQMRSVLGAETLDESAVRALTAAQAEIKAQLLVAHVETRRQVHALLTPEQREKADALMERGHKGKRGACRMM